MFLNDLHTLKYIHITAFHSTTSKHQEPFDEVLSLLGVILVFNTNKTQEKVMCTLLFFCFVLFVFFKTGFLCVALAVLELTLQTRLSSNSEIHLPLPSKCWGMHHHCPAGPCFFFCFFFLRFIYLLYVNTLQQSSDTPEEGVRSRYGWL